MINRIITGVGPFFKNSSSRLKIKFINPQKTFYKIKKCNFGVDLSTEDGKQIEI